MKEHLQDKFDSCVSWSNSDLEMNIQKQCPNTTYTSRANDSTKTDRINSTKWNATQSFANSMKRIITSWLKQCPSWTGFKVGYLPIKEQT